MRESRIKRRNGISATKVSDMPLRAKLTDKGMPEGLSRIGWGGLVPGSEEFEKGVEHGNKRISRQNKVGSLKEINLYIRNNQGRGHGTV